VLNKPSCKTISYSNLETGLKQSCFFCKKLNFGVKVSMYFQLLCTSWLILATMIFLTLSIIWCLDRLTNGFSLFHLDVFKFDFECVYFTVKFISLKKYLHLFICNVSWIYVIICYYNFHMQSCPRLILCCGIILSEFFSPLKLEILICMVILMKLLICLTTLVVSFHWVHEIYLLYPYKFS
jgi:hypothetical protein